MADLLPYSPPCCNADDLYEIIAETTLEFNKYKEMLQELVEARYIETHNNIGEDVLMYRARTDITWTKVSELADPMKKKILLQLIENPRTFFVLFNTQKGKLRIAGKEMSKWANDQSKRVVSFLIVDNDRTLSEQSVNGLFHCFEKRPNHEELPEKEKYNVEIFELSSSNKTSLKDIVRYIDAYAYNPNYHMPVIVALANKTQIEKVLKILDHIRYHPSKTLSSGVIWDEADRTYPMFRDKPFTIRGISVTYLEFVNDESIKPIYRTGFVTATDGPLLEEEYVECANAYHYAFKIDPEDEADYCAFHHTESKKTFIKCTRKESNNLIANKVITNNWDTHFNVPLVLRDGTPYYRKVIVNSDAKGDDMRIFAQAMVGKGAYATTFNQYGITLYTPASPNGTIKYSTKKTNFNKLLFYIYKKNNLSDKPLIIIGRRKVDRGLGFHYAPRRKGVRIVKIEGKDGPCQTDGIEGLIWTDLILGNKIEVEATAIQKAGRGAGIIRQCPQYPGQFHYWVEEETSGIIERHYKKVDESNNLSGSNTMLQAMIRADAVVPKVQKNHTVEPETFLVIRGTTPDNTLLKMKDIVQTIFNNNYRNPNRDTDRPEFYKRSLNTESCIVKLIDAVKKVPGAYGTNNGINTYHRFFPAYSNMADSSSLYCVIPLIDPAYTEEMKNEIKRRYANNIHEVPKEGSLDHLLI